MSLAYKVEELLALRDSVSESAVSIDKFADEDVIKEHVLRPSVSANVIRSTSFEKPLRASATPGVSAANTNLKKPSPSPSVKRGKAERLLKEHGSPPGMRVTAGGRVVPSDLPPLSTVRFGSNNFKPQGLRSLDPNNTMAPQAQPDGISNLNNNFAAQVQIVGTQALIRVGNQMYALPAYDASYPMPSVVAPGLDAAKQPAAAAKFPAQNGIPAVPHASQANTAQSESPYLGVDLPTLKMQWESKKTELRTVEQTEVLQADWQPPAWRSEMIARKKRLILEIDALRKQISAAKEAEAPKPDVAPIHTAGLTGATASSANTASAFAPPFQQPIVPGLYPSVGAPLSIPNQSTFPPLMMYQPYGAAGPQSFPADLPQLGRDSQFFAPVENLANVSDLSLAFKPVNGAQSPGSAGRRSHAVPIKKPNDETRKQVAQGSTLDPKSPTYEPVNVMRSMAMGKIETGQHHQPPTPSPAKPSSWSTNEGSGLSNKHADRAISQKPSLSSIDTTDFFPTNTHEHSSTRIAPHKLSNQSSCENTAIPATPDKSWPNGPWNQPNPPSAGHSSRATAGASAHNDPTTKLTSWPEAFGKPTSIPSSASKPTAQPGGSSSALRQSSTAQTETDLQWPPILSKAVPHSPSTYQEGYQAGLFHSGLPENIEVLYGFLDGLVAFLKDQSAKDDLDKKMREFHRSLFSGQFEQDTHSASTSALRGCLSGVTLSEPPRYTENVRSAKAQANPIPSGTMPMPSISSAPLPSYRQSVYNPKDADSSVSYTLGTDLVQESESYARGSNVTTSQEQEYARLQYGLPKNRMEQTQEGMRNSSASFNGMGDQTRSDLAQASLAFSRQFSGNQLANRGYGTPIHMQRYFPQPKEYLHGVPNGDKSNLASRRVSRQRLSGLDGAMDDLAGIMIGTQIGEKAPAESSEADRDASRFKPNPGKGKQANPSGTTASSSSDKVISEMSKDNTKDDRKHVSSPSNVNSSPKKSAEHSPAKAKLEQVTSRLRRPRKDDPRTMSPDDRQKRTEKWRGRFRNIKNKEEAEVQEYRNNAAARKEAAESGRR